MNQYWIIAFIVWSAGMFGAGFEVESWRSGEQAARLGEAQQKVTIAAEQGVIDKEQKSSATTERVSHDYESNILRVDGEYDATIDRLYHSNPPAGYGLSALPAGQPGHPSAACPAGFPRSKQEAVLKLMKQADEQTARLVACQNWIKDQGQ